MYSLLLEKRDTEKCSLLLVRVICLYSCDKYYQISKPCEIIRQALVCYHLSY